MVGFCSTQLFLLCITWTIILKGRLDGSVFIAFTLHTDPGASVPEFTISCQTRGGPPTEVEWSVNETRIEEVTDHNTSQIVLDTYNVEYESRLLVRSRTSGNYTCSITNNVRYFLSHIPAPQIVGSLIIRGETRKLWIIFCISLLLSCRRAH